MTTSFRCGIVGLGRHMLRSLLPNILADADWHVVAAADPDSESRRKLAERLPSAQMFETGGQLIDKGHELGLQAVFIAADPRSQRDLALHALAEGLDVFVEKPCATDADAVRPLVDAATRSGRICMVGTMWRHANGARLLHRLAVEEPRERSLETISILAYFPPLFLRPGWVDDPIKLAFLDMFIHPIDFACWFLPGAFDVQTIRAREFESGRGAAGIWLRCSESGRTASLNLVCGSHAYGVEIAATCSDGSLLSLTDLRKLTMIGGPTWTGTEGGIRDRPYLGWEQGPLYRGYARHGYAEEIAAFREAVHSRNQPASAIEHSLKTMETIDTALSLLRPNHIEFIASPRANSRDAVAQESSADCRPDVLARVAEALGVDVIDLGPEPTFGVTPLWDSVGHMNIMAAIEEGFAIEISDEETLMLVSAQLIAAHLAKRVSAT